MIDLDLDDLDGAALADNTPANRVAAALPAECHAWSFGSFPGDPVALDIAQRWALAPVPLGLVLQGPPGLGKTGLAVSIAREWAENGVGSRGLWNLMTFSPYRLEAQAGRIRPRPAPVWFERWPDLRDRLRGTWGLADHALREEALHEELRNRVTALVVDDLDVDAASDWKEAVVLRLLCWPERGLRLVVTVNVQVEELPRRLGDRSADRLLDPSHFRLVRMSGRSLRRRLDAGA